jgi:hypothetical protein
LLSNFIIIHRRVFAPRQGKFTQGAKDFIQIEDFNNSMDIQTEKIEMPYPIKS